MSGLLRVFYWGVMLHSELVISECPQLEWFRVHSNMSPLKTTPVAFVGDLKILSMEYGRVLLVVIPTKVSSAGCPYRYEIEGEVHIRRQGHSVKSAFTKGVTVSMIVALNKMKAVISVEDTRDPQHVGPSLVREPFVLEWLKLFKLSPRPKPLPLSASQPR